MSVCCGWLDTVDFSVKDTYAAISRIIMLLGSHGAGHRKEKVRVMYMHLWGVMMRSLNYTINLHAHACYCNFIASFPTSKRGARLTSPQTDVLPPTQVIWDDMPIYTDIDVYSNDWIRTYKCMHAYIGTMVTLMMTIWLLYAGVRSDWHPHTFERWHDYL